MSPTIQLGLKENLGQFSLLVLVNAFVGGMVGLERTIVPLISSQEFGLVLRTAIFSIIATFGLVKAFSNLFAGGLDFGWWVLGSVLLGLGTAMVYPSLIATVSDASHPSWRARSLSVYHFWRDLGYAVGALSAGVIADILGILWAISSGGRSRLGVRASSRVFRHHGHQGYTKRERRKRRSLSLPQGISPLQLFECYYFLAFGPLYSILLVAVLDALSVPLTAEPDCAKVSVAFAAPSASWSSAVVLMFLMSSQAWW